MLIGRSAATKQILEAAVKPIFQREKLRSSWMKTVSPNATLTANHVMRSGREKKMPKRLKQISLWLPPAYIEGLDFLVSQHLYANRSDAIRNAVVDLLKMEKSPLFFPKQK